jgi:hypothetical protein
MDLVPLDVLQDAKRSISPARNARTKGGRPDTQYFIRKIMADSRLWVLRKNTKASGFY